MLSSSHLRSSWNGAKMNHRVIFLFSINLFLSRYTEEDRLVSTLLNGTLSLSLSLKMKNSLGPLVNKKKSL